MYQTHFSPLYLRTTEDRGCTVNYFCCGSTLIFVGSVFLCALGFLVIYPYQITKDWEKVKCTVDSGTTNSSFCACGQDPFLYPRCDRLYPCYQLSVLYATRKRSHIPSASSDKGTRQPWQRNKERKVRCSTQLPELRSTEFPPACLRSRKRRIGDEAEREGTFTALLFRTWRDIGDKHCSLHECGDQEYNWKEINLFARKWGKVNNTFSCYANPSDPRVVVLRRTEFWQMFHAALWPSLCLGTGLTLLIGLYLGFWHMEPEYQTPYYGIL